MELPALRRTITAPARLELLDGSSWERPHGSVPSPKRQASGGASWSVPSSMPRVPSVPSVPSMPAVPLAKKASRAWSPYHAYCAGCMLKVLPDGAA